MLSLGREDVGAKKAPLAMAIDLTKYQLPSQAGSAPTAPLNLDKYKVAGSAPQPQGRGLFESIVKRPIERLLVEPACRTGEAIGSGFVGLFGNEQQKQAAADEVSEDKTLHVPFLGDFQTRGLKNGNKQVAGEALESASYLFPYGKAAGAASKVLPRTVASMASGAAGGYLK
jgi:hypothetical protein